jgi:large subunit ribosomal protein L32
MAVPKRKTSQQRKHSRRANWKTASPTLVECSRCHQPKLGHRACPNCGYYDGEKVIVVASEKKDEKTKAKEEKAEQKENKAQAKSKAKEKTKTKETEE